MNLLDIRTEFVKRMGRFDLVVDTTNYADNGANEYIQAAQRQLDSEVPGPKSLSTYVKDIAANQTKLDVTYLRSIEEVWVKKSGTDRSELFLRSYSWMHEEYSGDWGAKALGEGTFSAVPSADETLTINSDTYTFKASASASTEITIGATVTATIANLVAAINAHSSVVKTYQLSATEFTVEAVIVGTAANSYVFTTTAGNLSLNGSGTLGGTLAGRASGVSTGTPLYYTPMITVPPASLTVDNMGSLDTLGLVFGYDRYKQDGILFLPPADEAYTVSVHGYFRSKLEDDVDVSWHSTQYPELLIAMSCFMLELFYRNTQGMRDWMLGINKIKNAIDHDLVREEMAMAGNQMRG